MSLPNQILLLPTSNLSQSLLNGAFKVPIGSTNGITIPSFSLVTTCNTNTNTIINKIPSISPPTPSNNLQNVKTYNTSTCFADFGFLTINDIEYEIYLEHDFESKKESMIKELKYKAKRRQTAKLQRQRNKSKHINIETENQQLKERNKILQEENIKLQNTIDLLTNELTKYKDQSRGKSSNTHILPNPGTINEERTERPNKRPLEMDENSMNYNRGVKKRKLNNFDNNCDVFDLLNDKEKLIINRLQPINIGICFSCLIIYDKNLMLENIKKAINIIVSMHWQIDYSNIKIEFVNCLDTPNELKCVKIKKGRPSNKSKTLTSNKLNYNIEKQDYIRICCNINIAKHVTNKYSNNNLFVNNTNNITNIIKIQNEITCIMNKIKNDLQNVSTFNNLLNHILSNSVIVNNIIIKNLIGLKKSESTNLKLFSNKEIQRRKKKTQREKERRQHILSNQSNN